jgi:hypothetical protein
MTERIQIQFTHFPGVQPITQERGWRHLPLPWRTVDPDDMEAVSDASMELVDYAIERSPETFGVDVNLATAGYEPYNDLSIDLVGRIHDAIEGKGRVKGGGGLWAEWYADAPLADDVVVRVACFR